MGIQKGSATYVIMTMSVVEDKHLTEESEHSECYILYIWCYKQHSDSEYLILYKATVKWILVITVLNTPMPVHLGVVVRLAAAQGHIFFGEISLHLSTVNLRTNTWRK